MGQHRKTPDIDGIFIGAVNKIPETAFADQRGMHLRIQLLRAVVLPKENVQLLLL